MAQKLCQLKKKGGKAGVYGNPILITQSKISSYTFNDNYDLIQLVTGRVGTDPQYKPTFRGVTYTWLLEGGGSSYQGAGLVFQNVKAGETLSFSTATGLAIYGYKFS